MPEDRDHDLEITPVEKPNLLKLLALNMLDVAEKEIGNGEEGANNMGPHIDRYAKKKGTKGSWCAAFVSYCGEAAAADMKVRLPWRRSHGAKTLFRRIGDAGYFVEADEGGVPAPGDAVCWDRGAKKANGKPDWRGHIGLVKSYDEATDTLVTIEGNRGPYPAKVAEFTYTNGKWRKRLEGLARMW